MAFKFRTKATRETSPANDYGDPAVRSNRLLRPLLSATHALHLISSLIVLGISAYFINNYTHNTHLVYWVALVRPLTPRTNLFSLPNTSIQSEDKPNPNQSKPTQTKTPLTKTPTVLHRHLPPPPRPHPPLPTLLQKPPSPPHMDTVIPLAHGLHLRSPGLRVQRWMRRQLT